jgi:hypothetical protein
MCRETFNFRGACHRSWVNTLFNSVICRGDKTLCSVYSIRAVHCMAQLWSKDHGTQTRRILRHTLTPRRPYYSTWQFAYARQRARAGRPGDRIPVGGEIFRTRPDRAWGPPNLLYNGYRLFHVGKAARAWCWSPTPSSTEVKERVELYIFSPSGPPWPVVGRTLPLPLRPRALRLGRHWPAVGSYLRRGRLAAQR